MHISSIYHIKKLFEGGVGEYIRETGKQCSSFQNTSSYGAGAHSVGERDTLRALTEATAAMFPPGSRLRHRKTKHVLLTNCCFRTELPGIGYLVPCCAAI